jgi:multidrug efflux system outer membrane protein
MMRTIAISILICSLSLSGCLLGPDFKRPVVETEEKYRFETVTGDSPVNLKWWELFDDPVLASLVIMALQENKDVLIAASRIEEARAFLGFTRADQYPRLDIEGDASRGNIAGIARAPSTDNNFYIAPALSWEIDFWGKFRRATESARAELLASEYGLRTVQISLISEVISTYFLLLDYHQRLEISRRTLDSRVKSLKIIQLRFDYGIVPELDVNQAQILKEVAAAAIPFYQRSIGKTENTLSILLGRLPDTIQKGTPLEKQSMPPGIPTGLPSSLLNRRPDIMQTEYLLQAQNAKIGIAQALRLPAIRLTGRYGGASDELDSLTSGGAAWSAGGSLVGPLFDFKQSAQRVEIERERTRQALLAYENTVLLAFREVEDALIEIETYREEIAATERRTKAARNATALSNERYDKGVTSFLEVLDNERILFDVELELSQIQQNYLNAYVRLYKALGGGWISTEEMETAKAQSASP